MDIVRRISLLVVTVMLTMVGLTFAAGSASAAPVCTFARGLTTCVEQTTITKQETRVLSTTTEYRTTDVTVPCQVGNSPRTGTQSATETQEVLVTTYGVYDVEYTRTTTTVYRGNGTNGQVVSTGSVDTPTGQETLVRTYTEETPVGEPTITPTGNCRNTPGPQNPQAA
jgi:hypothetical protein